MSTKHLGIGMTSQRTRMRMVQRLREQGAEVVGSSPTELAAYVATEIPKWAALARQAGIKAD